MRKILFSSLLLTVSWWSATATAQERFPKNGQVYQAFQADLNHDGKPDKIGLVAYRVTEEEYWGQLTVWDSSGKVLWRGPQAKTAEDPLAFGGWPYGVSEIEYVGDLYGDGQVELIAPAPQSDVRPATFRILRWNGSAFAPVTRQQLLEKPIGSGHFLWSPPAHWNGQNGSWVGRLERQGSDIVAHISMVSSGSNYKFGKARVSSDKKGVHVKSWVEKLKQSQ